MNKSNNFILGLSENSKNIIANILIVLSFILYVLSVYNTKVATIPYYLGFGLLEVLPITFPLAIILLAVSILINIEKMSELKYIALLILLSDYVWGIRVFVESYAFAHDAWGMGYIAKEVFETGNFSFADQIKPAMYYIGWPGAFIFLASLVHITGIQIIDLLKIYPILISPIQIFSVYALFRTFSRNQSRYAALFFLVVNNFIYTHWSPQSISIILFITLFLLIKKIEKSTHSLIAKSLIFITVFSIVVIHPTMSLILIIFLICLLILMVSKTYIKSVYFDTFLPLDYLTRLTLLSIVLFIVWNYYISNYNFNSLANQTLPNIANILTAEKTTSFAIQRATSLAIATKIRAWFFLFSGLITMGYLSYTFFKNKAIKTYEFSFLMTAIAFYLLDINLTKGAYFERIFMIAYLAISSIFGMIYIKFNEKKHLLKYTFISFLLITFTFYDHDILDLYSESVINGYSFALSNGYGKSAAISADTYTIAQPFLILNNTLFLGENARFKDINISLPIKNYYIISDSNAVKWNFDAKGQINQYNDFISEISNNFSKVYENPAIIIYLNQHYSDS